jgi:integrase
MEHSPTRRSATGGMIREHPARQLWEARYTAADGRKRSLYAKTRREAQERLRTALLEADHNIVPVRERVTVGAYLEDWLTTSVQLRCRPRTVESYAETVKRYIKPSIGRIELTKLTPEHVSAMLATLQARGTLSPTTVRYSHVVLRAALGRALKTGRVYRNVASLVDPPARIRREMTPLTAAQVGEFLEAAEGDRLRVLYLVAIGTGLRQGELLALRWSDIDLDAWMLSVRHTLQRGTRTLEEPKTERGKRTLRLGNETREALLDHARRQRRERLAAGSSWRDGDYVFTTLHGLPLDGRNVLEAFHRALDRARLPRRSFHSLRHAFATLQIENGEELGVVSRILGHSQIATTADVYAHLTPAMLERSANRMDGILKRRVSNR